MGFDRLSNFINRNLNYNNNFIIEELSRKFLGNHILFDLNFIIYNQMFILEEEVNKIIKIILNLPFCHTKTNKTNDKLLEILELPWWKRNCENIEYLIDGDNENDIISKLVNFINTKQENGLNKIDLMLIDKIIYTTENFIEKYNNIKNIQTIGFFIDGIPSFSKIMEQRKRRTKNYFESINRKKKFNDYFGNIKNIYMEEEGIKYNYFKWIEKRFSLDKSLSPICPVIKKLESSLLKYYTSKYSKIEFFVNPGSINGESDIKIFQFIHSKKLTGDVLIHTTDSDLIHLILIQQNYFNLKRVDINISLIKHNSKDDEQIQYFDSQNMITALIKTYQQFSNSSSTDYRIINDFSFLLWFFGNDHLPSSFEIGPELGLDYIMKLYSSLKLFIVSINNDNIEIDFENLKRLLIEFNKTASSNFTKILLNRNFRLTPYITSLLTDNDKLNLTFEEVLIFIKNVLINDGLKIKEQLDSSDIRHKLIQSNKNIFDFNAYLNDILVKKISNEGFRESIKNQLLNNLDSILELLDFTSLDNSGLTSYKKPFLKTNDNYQDLYNILTENTVSELNSKNRVLYEPLKEEFINLNKTEYNYEISYNYIKKIFHLTTSFFGNISKYHTNNITSYNFDYVPKIDFLIRYLNENNDLDKMKKEIESENLNEKDYFNSVNHHIFITAYLQLEELKDDTTKSKAKALNINDLWIGNNTIENFKHNNVKALNFLNEWESSVKEIEVPSIINPNDFQII